MSQPMWIKVVSEKAVPENPGTQWTLALEILTQGKLMKIEVVVDNGRVPPVTGTWTPRDYVAPCSADGDFSGEARGNLAQQGTPLLASAPVGALIARIGGSTADLTLDQGSAGTNPSRIGFAVGRVCIFSVPNAPIGALFLGINDDPVRMGGVAGSLLVNIYEAR